MIRKVAGERDRSGLYLDGDVVLQGLGHFLRTALQMQVACNQIHQVRGERSQRH